MAPTDPPDRQDDHDPELPRRDQWDSSDDPAGRAFRLQLLILIRYLCDERKLPAERFREAERELNLTDVMTRERAAAIDNLRYDSRTDDQGTTAVLIHTLLATQAADAAAEAS